MAGELEGLVVEMESQEVRRKPNSTPNRIVILEVAGRMTLRNTLTNQQDSRIARWHHGPPTSPSVAELADSQSIRLETTPDRSLSTKPLSKLTTAKYQVPVESPVTFHVVTFGSRISTRQGSSSGAIPYLIR